MADIIIYSVYDVYLIGIATVLTFITAIRYFGLAKRKENPDEKSIVNAYAWIFVFLMISLILANLRYFYLEGDYFGHNYWANFDNPSLIYLWLSKGAIISYYAAFIYYFYTYEKILNKRIHLATFANILIIILIIFLPYDLAVYQFNSIAFTIVGLYTYHTLFTLMKKSWRELRAATSFIIIGVWFIGASIAYMGPRAIQIGVSSILIFPVFYIFGIFLTMSPTVFKPEFFSRNIKYWYLFSIILIGATAIALIYMAIRTVVWFEFFIMALVLLIYFVVECLFLIRFIKREKSLGAEGDIGIRGIFTKPEKVTEEEVSISKEKKICLVCKGKVGGNMFMCTDCGAFYCQKCSEALSNLENACWACNEAIDKSKPVKLPEKEEEKVIVEEKKTKKKPPHKK